MNSRRTIPSHISISMSHVSLKMSPPPEAKIQLDCNDYSGHFEYHMSPDVLVLFEENVGMKLPLWY